MTALADLRAFVERPREELAALTEASPLLSGPERWRASHEEAARRPPDPAARAADLLHHIELAARLGALGDDDRRDAR